MERSMNFIDE
jgi:dynein heavy chain 1